MQSTHKLGGPTPFDAYILLFSFSSIVLGFLNPTSQLQHADVTTFCMQLRNRQERFPVSLSSPLYQGNTFSLKDFFGELVMLIYGNLTYLFTNNTHGNQNII